MHSYSHPTRPTAMNEVAGHGVSCNKTEPQSSDMHFFTTALKQFQLLQNSSSAMPTRRDMCRSQPKHALGTLGKTKHAHAKSCSTKHAHAKSRSTKHAHAKSCSNASLCTVKTTWHQLGKHNKENFSKQIQHRQDFLSNTQSTTSLMLKAHNLWTMMVFSCFGSACTRPSKCAVC